MPSKSKTLAEVDKILSEICPRGSTIEKAEFVVKTVKNAGKYIRSLQELATEAGVYFYPVSEGQKPETKGD